MVKVYLFRKLSTLNQTQRDVYEEAVTGILEQVLQGRVSTIFNYGDWSSQFTHQEPNDTDDVVRRTIDDLFHHIYAMEQSMEINVSINHIEMNARHTHIQTAEDSDGKIPKISEEHFVSASKDVFIYMEKVMQRFLQNDLEKGYDLFAHVLFTIDVTQTNLEKTLKHFGKLQLMQLMTVETSTESAPSFDDSPMKEVFKIVRALAHNSKTHIRYYNIRLTHLLKELLGPTESTVVINYTEMPQFYIMLMGPPTSPILSTAPHDQYAEFWKELYMQERRKYTRLREKVINLNFSDHSNICVKARKLVELLEVLDQSSSDADLDTDDNKTTNSPICYENVNPKIETTNGEFAENNDLGQNIELCDKELKVKGPLQMQYEIDQIQLEIKNLTDELLKLQESVRQIEKHNKHNEQQLKHKDFKLARLNELIVKANKEMHRQKMGFLKMLTKYSEMYSRLWQKQYTAMQWQGKQHEQQLTKMFDSLCEELHSSHRMQLVKLNQQLEQINKPVNEQDLTTLQL